MATDSFIFQGQGRLQVTLDTNTTITGVESTDIEYLTPSGTETIVTGIVTDSTKITASISPLPDEYGLYEFHSRVVFTSGENPVLGRPVYVRVRKKWDGAAQIS